MNELNTSLYGTLSAATALTTLLPGTTSFYYQIPPDNPTYPLVVWNLQGGGDLNMTPKRRKSLVVYIRAYSKVSAAQAGSIDKQIDTLLHGKSLSVSGWSNYWLMRESDVELVENPPDGNKIYSAGGFYRVEIEKS